ncbi:tyrosinase precursor [Fusarium denticulatum]|uniref:Tyrosinase n=1 Tax=Fusarium denticulatum TaxID=48507 RepID=A0A8H5WR39_9HYPO|nr:tyrosinase precursor [Fusarium denticulatum]
MEFFKPAPVDDKLAYFQIAGFHGYGSPEPKHAPDKKTKQAGDQPFRSYYNHDSLNCPAWHRQYLLLFGQLMWENFKLIVNNRTSDHGLLISEADERHTAAKH